MCFHIWSTRRLWWHDLLIQRESIEMGTAECIKRWLLLGLGFFSWCEIVNHDGSDSLACHWNYLLSEWKIFQAVKMMGGHSWFVLLCHFIVYLKWLWEEKKTSIYCEIHVNDLLPLSAEIYGDQTFQVFKKIKNPYTPLRRQGSGSLSIPFVRYSVQKSPQTWKS